MKLQYISFTLFLVLLACNSNHKNSGDNTMHASHENMNTNNKEGLSCSVHSDSLIGKGYLDAKFLQQLDNVQTDPKFAKDTEGMKFIKGGTFEMGGDVPTGFEGLPSTALAQPDEYPKHPVKVNDFYMDEHEVTVREFKEFVDATGYKTVAEHPVDWEEIQKQLPAGTPKPDDIYFLPGSYVFHYVPEGTPKNDLTNWWSYIPGANWKNPDGKTTDINTILDNPVTQVSWYDALAYARWKGKRLPTEAEYEYAMRAGKQNQMYPWGNEKVTPTSLQGNFLQGDFPYNNTGMDGFKGVAPVKSFEPNSYGLYDISGNVWEWTMDWYGANYYKTLKDANMTADNPKGPESTFEVYAPNAVNKVVRGGSFLCNDSWCSGYRNARRMRISPDSGMQHLGFRCVKEVAK